MKPNPVSRRLLAGAIFAALAASPALRAETRYIDLGGPAAGYLAVSNMKNSTSQDGIENKTGGNGLEDYPNYQIPAGQANAGRWTAIIASPQFAGADYSRLYAYGGVSAGDVTVNNQTITDSNYSTLSAGLIGFDSSLLTGLGTETIGVSSLTFNLNTYEWDGYTANGWNTGTGTINISPFSPVYTDYNDGGGAGNAAGFYDITLSNVTGTGLTFVDGELVSMDIDADLNIVMRIGNFPTLGSLPFAGTFSASGLGYAFDLDAFGSVFVFSDVHMVMNREGTASLLPSAVPEPASAAALLGAFALGAVALRRRARR